MLSSSVPRNPSRLATADTALGVLGAALITCAFAFAAFGIPPIPPGLLVVLGVPSPLTGMTRSFVAIAERDVAGAFSMHPLGPLCFLACAVAAISLLISRRTKRPKIVDRMMQLPYAGWIVAGAFVVAWVRQIVVFS